MWFALVFIEDIIESRKRGIMFNAIVPVKLFQIKSIIIIAFAQHIRSIFWDEVAEGWCKVEGLPNGSIHFLERDVPSISGEYAMISQRVEGWTTTSAIGFRWGFVFWPFPSETRGAGRHDVPYRRFWEYQVSQHQKRIPGKYNRII
jgi:hypothetical protein